ncbi:MAG: hypothetical protein PS018_12085 [bacterium]|nr:hypothetical protein [bacterium]
MDTELDDRLFGPRKPLKSLLADLERSLDFAAPQAPDDEKANTLKPLIMLWAKVSDLRAGPNPPFRTNGLNR